MHSLRVNQMCPGGFSKYCAGGLLSNEENVAGNGF